jgi:hypothetical protein
VFEGLSSLTDSKMMKKLTAFMHAVEAGGIAAIIIICVILIIIVFVGVGSCLTSAEAWTRCCRR